MAYVRSGIVVAGFLLLAQVYSLSDSEMRNTLKTIITPEGYPSIQIQALRRELARRLMQEAEKQAEADELQEFKNTLSRIRTLPDKKNLEALARGGYIRTQPPVDADPDSLKRSDGGASGGDVPFFQAEEKKGIQSLARNGDLNKRQRQAGELTDEDVRNLEDLVLSYKYGEWVPYPNVYKRNVAALAREGMRVTGKRDDGDKRNIGSIKAQYKPGRNRRQIDYYDAVSDEYPSPVYQNQNVYDYEELMKELTGSYPNTEKRFLGSLARSGWLRSPSRSGYYKAPEKRHIGALARIGWLPAFRSVRRFNRSGRSANYLEPPCSRQAAANGKNEDDTISESTVLLGDKRFYYHPFTSPAFNKKYIPRQNLY